MSLLEARIRSFAQGEDDAPLRELFGCAFGQARSPEYFRWKYRENPAGPAEISIAEVGGRAGSMACALPLRMVMRGKPLLGSISVDIATRPELRGRGLYGETARHLWRRLAQRGYALTFGFTNRLSTRLTLEELGRREVGTLPVRVRPLRPLALALSRVGLARTPRARELPRPEHPAIQPIEHFDERFDRLWQRLEPSVDIAVVRDARFLEWRYASHPERAYDVLAMEREQEVSGYLAWRTLDRFGTRAAFVADLAADPNFPSDAVALLQTAAARARAAGATLLSLLSWPGNPIDDAGRRFAALRLPRALFPQPNVFSVISHRDDPSTDSLADSTRWWLAWGDSDVL